MRTTWKLLWQTAVLTAIFIGCDQLTRLTGIPIPGNVLGIIVLFFLLLTGIVKESHISLAAEFFLRHLVFFFVPIAVGLMQWSSVFYEDGWVLAAAIVGSTALPLVIVGFMARGLRRSTDKKQALDKEDAPCRS